MTLWIVREEMTISSNGPRVRPPDARPKTLPILIFSFSWEIFWGRATAKKSSLAVEICLFKQGLVKNIEPKIIKAKLFLKVTYCN